MGSFASPGRWAGILVLAIAAPALAQSPRQLYDYHFEEGRKFQNAGRPREALPHFQAALEAAKQVPGGVERADRLYYNLGMAQGGAGFVKEMFETMGSVEAWRRKNLGNDDPDTILVLRWLAIQHNLHGHLVEAEAYDREVIALSEKRYGADSTQVADALANAMPNLHNLGKLDEVHKFAVRCLAIREAKLGTNNYYLRDPLQQLASGAIDKGEYSRAEAIFQRIAGLEPRKDGNPKTAPIHRAEYLSNLAAFYTQMGRYLEAEACYREQLAIYAKLMEHQPTTYAPLQALTLSVVGDLYVEMGLPDKAMGFYLAAMERLERLNAPGSASYALQGIGRIHQQRGELVQAEANFQRSLDLGKNNRSLILLAAHVAALLRDKGEYEESAQLFSEAVSQLIERFGEKSPYITRIRLEQGELEAARGNRAAAAKLFQQVIDASGVNTAGNPDTADGQLALARLARTAGERQSALTAADKARREMRRFTSRVLPALGEHEQLEFLAHRDAGSFQQALAMALDYRDDRTARETAAGWVLNAKGLVQEAVAQRTLLARGTNDPRQAAVLREWLAIRFRLARMAIAEGTPVDAQARERELATLSSREQILAGQLGRSHAAEQVDPWIELAAVREKLPRDAMLIEIVRYTPFVKKTFKKVEPKSEPEKNAKADKPAVAPAEAAPRYLAWLIPPAGPGEVQLVDLGPAEEMDLAVAAARKLLLGAREAILETGEAEAEEALQKELAVLSKRLLEPMRPHLAESKHWIISPDASLWLVPWSALSLEKGKYLVETHVTRFVVSGRDVVEQSGKQASGNAPLVLADPDFDLTDKAGPEGTSGTRSLPVDGDSSSTRAMRLAAVRGAVASSWQRLPGTAQEAKELEPKLSAYTRSKIELHTGRAAVEQIVRDAWQPRVVVLSTHGYFLDRPSDSGNAPLTLMSPLVRCGLVLAGANRRGQSASTDDGILTGLEIVGSDLRGTELVVLSACETGLGEVRSAEGVVGLRQAFQLAGAQSVLASLWRVPDADTAQLMSGFYDRLTVTGDKAVALREAQVALLESKRKTAKSGHPYFWAAFTLTGRSDRPEVSLAKPRPARPVVLARVQVVSATASIMDGSAQVALARQGELLEVTAEQGEWLLVPVAGRAKPGWILKRHVRAIDE